MKKLCIAKSLLFLLFFSLLLSSCSLFNEGEIAVNSDSLPPPPNPKIVQEAPKEITVNENEKLTFVELVTFNTGENKLLIMSLVVDGLTIGQLPDQPADYYIHLYGNTYGKYKLEKKG